MEFYQLGCVWGGRAQAAGADKGAAPSAEAALQAISQATAQSIEQISARYLGRPYDSSGPLGEGPDGTVSTKPLMDETRFDCVTFIEEVVAQAVSKTPEDVLSNLTRLRYAGGKVDYVTRNHFAELDWIPHNLANGAFTDITPDVGGGETRQVTAMIDRGRFLTEQGTEVARKIGFFREATPVRRSAPSRGGSISAG